MIRATALPVALLLAMLLSAGCNKTAAPAVEVAVNAEPQAIPVTVEKVALRPVQRVVYISATIHGLEEVVVTPEVEGIVRRLHHEVGDRVRPGEVLVELDPTNYQLAAAEAKQALQQCTAMLLTGPHYGGWFGTVRRAQVVAQFVD